MLKYEDFYKAREEIIDIVSCDLIGPVTRDEVLIEMPTQYYVMGKLYPREREFKEDTIEDITTNAVAESNTDSYDCALASTNIRNPSTMGITFTIKPGVKTYDVKFSYARYSNYALEEIQQTAYSIEKYKADIDDKTIFWVRTGKVKVFSFKTGQDEEFDVDDETVIRSYTHKVFNTGEYIITI
ncbi:MAG: hypothetical protein K2O54_05355, partial [Prevotella sp.]|nr:hypothetical protein [Prevotella sp.]